jgi:tRNA G18 (ribose-2'-O)-methylase SpoU
MNEVEKLTTKEILSRNLKRQTPNGMQQLVAVLHDVRSMHNVGAAFRNADAFGISKLILSGFTPKPPRAEISKTAIGAEEFVDWESPKTISHEIKKLKNEGYTLLGVEQTDRSELLTEYTPPKNNKVCLIFGNEVTGLDEEILPLIDKFVEIPQYGNKHSLNVSVTVGVTFYAFLQKYWP